MDESNIKGYRDLTIWQRTKAFAVGIYRVTESFPSHEQQGLTSKIRQAAVSMPTNIAAGHITGSSGVVVDHMAAALGAAAELDTQLEIALAVGYVQPDVYQALDEELGQIMSMLRSSLKAALVVNH